jgi:hypothetical protein
MSAAEQLFNVAVAIGLLTVIIIFKDQDQAVTDSVQDEVKIALELEETTAPPKLNNGPVKIAEIEMSFCSN